MNHAVDGDLFFSYKRFRSYLKLDHQERKTFTGFNGVNPPQNDKLTLFMYAYSWGADYTRPLTDRVEIKAQGGWHQDNWTEVGLIPMFQVSASGDSLALDSGGAPILDVVSIERDGQPMNTSFVIDGQGADTRTLEGELQVTWNYVKKNNLIFGLASSHDSVLKAGRPSEIQIVPFALVEFREFQDDANNWLFDTDASRTTLGLYGQVDNDLGRSWSFNAGARVDHYTGTGSLDQIYTELNPRAGLVYKNEAAGNVKLMYGRATRVPNGFETLSSVTILGSPANRPERIQTVQALWIKNWSDDVRTEFGGFRSVISNHLVTDADITEAMQAQGFIGQFRNLSNRDFTSTGIDGKLNLKLGARKAVDAFINFTQYLATDDGAGAEIGYITKTMVNGNVNIPVRWLNLNFGANYRGNFTQPRSDTRPAVRGYLLLSGTVSVESRETPIEARFGVRNLLDMDVHAPSSSTAFTEHFRQRGLELWGAFTYKF